MDDPSTWSISGLKQFLDDCGVDYTGVLEKEELVALVASVLGVDQPADTASEERSPAAASQQSASSENTEHDAVLTEFVAITGSSDMNAARQLLESTGWDLAQAINLHSDLYAAGDQPHGFADPFDQHDAEPADRRSRTSSAAPPVFDEDGIRAPDSIISERLVGPSYRPYGIPQVQRQQSEDPNVEWMFPPPTEINFPGAIEQARQVAKDSRKWLLVNIQNHQDFASHRLNRDTWTHDTVINVIYTHFVFWQRGSTSGDGEQYMQRYHLTEEDLPHIAMVDPRTGSEIVRIRGFVEGGDLAMSMMEFIADNSLDGTEAPKFRDIVMNRHPDLDQQDSDPQDSAAAEPARLPTPEPQMVLPDEPDESDPDATKVQIRLEGAPPLSRRFKKTDKVEALFALVIAHVREATPRNFELFTKFPKKNLSEHKQETLQEADLLNASCTMRWTA